MAEDFLRQGPLAHLGLAAVALPAALPSGELAPEQSVTLTERPFRTVVTLRGDLAEPAFPAAMEQVLGFALPEAVGSVAGHPQGREALCLGPDEWWITDPAEDAGPLVEALETATEGRFVTVVDTSDNWFDLEVAGPHARDLLAKACPLDLHPRVFGPGRCARSLLAKAPMTLQQLDATPSFRLYVRRSFADYSWRWLLDAGREYGVAVVAG